MRQPDPPHPFRIPWRTSATGDRFRLADTNLVCEVERDLTVAGEEAVFGGGKTIRDGMAQASGATNAGGALDLVITNAVVMDARLGVVKADIGMRDGWVVGRGEAGPGGTVGDGWGARGGGVALARGTGVPATTRTAAATPAGRALRTHVRGGRARGSLGTGVTFGRA